ncbi:MmgE/PrpD family protein [Brevibacillus brevis]|uniref:MmgE/PrpD family protein n=1 Tax=Brevibacillus brevis TaxID=1393 RepID=A0ABY9T4X8_BREBE|nr:MmgE/PrpD family protein [Brevibacillus brevis]WNC15144.1 MmgE/PrpD family protein [Brevibacillus brevis]
MMNDKSKHNGTLTKELARLVLISRPEKDEAAMEAARSGVIDFLASGFAASDDEGIRKLWRIIDAEGSRADVPVIGQKRKAGFLAASLLNGFIGHALDLDDVHSDVRGHPRTVILPALISVAATSPLSGERFLAAYTVGVETMARLGRAIGTSHYIRGWHNTATLGAIAAAVAAGYAKRFTAEQLETAIGFAATQASGFKVYPFCSAAHHAADAALRLATNHAFSTSDIEGVRIVFPPNGDAALVETNPRTGEQGRFSVEYVAALALNGYALSLQNFTRAPIDDTIRRFMPRVRRAYDERIEAAPHAVPKGRFTIVEVTTVDGHIYRERVDCPRGAPGNALSPEELRQKLADALAGAQKKADKVVKAVNELQDEKDLQALLALL